MVVLIIFFTWNSARIYLFNLKLWACVLWKSPWFHGFCMAHTKPHYVSDWGIVLIANVRIFSPSECVRQTFHDHCNFLFWIQWVHEFRTKNCNDQSLPYTSFDGENPRIYNNFGPQSLTLMWFSMHHAKPMKSWVPLPPFIHS